MLIQVQAQFQASLDEVDVDKDCKEAEEDNTEVVNALAMAIQSLSADYKSQYENYLKKSGVVISQLRADRDKLLEALDKISTEIEAYQSDAFYHDNVMINKRTILDIIDKYRTESEE